MSCKTALAPDATCTGRQVQALSLPKISLKPNWGQAHYAGLGLLHFIIYSLMAGALVVCCHQHLIIFIALCQFHTHSTDSTPLKWYGIVFMQRVQSDPGRPLEVETQQPCTQKQASTHHHSTQSIIMLIYHAASPLRESAHLHMYSTPTCTCTAPFRAMYVHVHLCTYTCMLRPQCRVMMLLCAYW